MSKNVSRDNVGDPMATATLAPPVTPTEAPNLLRTDQYTIWPYARGTFYPPDTLYALYRAMVDDRSLRRVLYAEKWLDLEAFCAYFTGTALYLAVTPDNQTVLGAVWFTSITERKANIGIWVARAWRGEHATQIGSRVCKFAFLFHRWDTIWGMTPWRDAFRLALRVGFRHVVSIPEGVDTTQGMSLPLYVVRLDNPQLTLHYGIRLKTQKER